MTRTRRLFAIAAALGIVAAAAGIGAVSVAGPSQASGSSSGPKTYSATASPTVLTLGADVPVTITLSNLGPNRISFEAAKVTVPAAYTLVGTPSTTRGTVLISGETLHTLHLKNVEIDRGQWVAITQTVRVACTTPLPAPAGVWTTDVRQSNEFNGTLNKFALALGGTDPTTTITAVSSPCFGRTVNCAVDGQACTTGEFPSPNGDTANITLNDNDVLVGQLKAQFENAALACPEYATTTDRLKFEVITLQDLTGMTKNLVITQEAIVGKALSAYYACFQAPYNFPAQLPSQLAEDFNNFDFSGNTIVVGAEFKGLLLPCQLNLGAPCIQSRAFVGTRIQLTLKVPAGDPFVSF